MKKAFLSSVVFGFEHFRSAAQRTIESFGYLVIKSEEFAARTYSSERACMIEVEQSDIYILLLGEKYGSLNSEGISITHQEYRAARLARKPILAFIQKCNMEPSQAEFKREVEHYTEGLFRGSFSNELELKDALTKGLNELNRRFSAPPEEDFRVVLQSPSAELRRIQPHDATIVRLGFWAAPSRAMDLSTEEAALDNYMIQLSKNKLAHLRVGYEPLSGKTWSGLRTPGRDGHAAVLFTEEGMVMVQVDPKVTRTNAHMDHYYVTPERLREIALGAATFFQANGGWISFELTGLEHRFVAKLPEQRNSGSVPTRYGEDTTFHEIALQIPFERRTFEPWLDEILKKLERRFGPK